MPNPHPAVTACSACCIADKVCRVERGGCTVRRMRGKGELKRGRGSLMYGVYMGRGASVEQEE